VHVLALAVVPVKGMAGLEGKLLGDPDVAHGAELRCKVINLNTKYFFEILSEYRLLLL
jgi:hypothetical protein